MLEPPLNPMLLSKRIKPFDSEEYIFEFKWDGYRCLSFINNKDVFLQSRNKKNLISYFPELSAIYKSVKVENIILDGEICYLENGRPLFNKLQGRLNMKNPIPEDEINLVIWDILAYNNTNIFQYPLLKRKTILKEIVNQDNRIIISPYIKNEGKKLFIEAEKGNLEGIVAKKINSPYQFKRSKYWYKIKCWKYTTTIIGGYTKDGSSLAIGRFDSTGNFIYQGKIKLSLSPEMETALFQFLPTIISSNCPFYIDPDLMEIFWVKPLIKTKIRYTELTHNNTYRHGSAVKILLD